MKDMTCYICFSASIRLYLKVRDKLEKSQDIFNLYQCLSCGLIFLFPKPRNLELGKFYVPAYWQKRGTSLIDKIYYTLVSRSKLRQIKSYKQAGKLLDVGCGTGEFLDFMRRNDFKVWGTEVFNYTGELAKKYTENICINFLPNCKFESSFFDVVNLTDVLHQMPEPENELKEIRRLIKSDGILVIEVPNSDCWQFKLLKQDWFCQDSPRHIFYFNQANISLLLEKIGFKVLTSKRLGLVFALDFFHGINLKMKRYPEIIRILLKPVLLVISIIIKLFPASRSSIRIIARPV